jgi:hypothetical protein
LFGIKTKIITSETFKLHEDKSQRLVNICIDQKATDYYTGPKSKLYIDEKPFEEKGIGLHYFNYDGYQPYRQLFGKFEHQVSIIDLILNEGQNAKHFLKSNYENINS